MLRIHAALAIVALAASDANAQSFPCYQASVIFVGRVGSATTYRISGEAAIEEARQKLARFEEQVARERASLDRPTLLERNDELEKALLAAREEFNIRRSLYPRPYDLTLMPVTVDTPLRGVTEPLLMLRSPDTSTTFPPGQQYLFLGYRARDLIPEFPETSDLGGISEYIEVGRAMPAHVVQREVELLAKTRDGVTLAGQLWMKMYGDASVGKRPSLPGVRIEVTSGSYAGETITNEDGSFLITGISAGQVVVRPLLSPDLTIVDPSQLSFVGSDGQCVSLDLGAALNGRVRGRILSAAGMPFDDVVLQLQGVAHIPSFVGRPGEDGKFEFSGVPPGHFVLSAWRQTVGDGRRHHTTFYPGAHTFAEAQLIEVGRATEHDGFEFVIDTE